MTYLAKYDFLILAEVQRAVALLPVKRFKIFQHILKALSMLFLQYIMINLVLTKSSGPKSHAVLLTAPIFAGFCVRHTDLSGEGQQLQQLSPHPRPHLPLALISLQTGHLSRLWADLPTNLWAIQPTCCEVADFKKAVSQRVNFVLHTYTFYIVCVVSVIISISCGQKQFSPLTSLHTKIQTKSYHASASLSVPCAHSAMSLINVGSSTISCIHGALLQVLLQDFHPGPQSQTK